jgi:hypothetical protein
VPNQKKLKVALTDDDEEVPKTLKRAKPPTPKRKAKPKKQSQTIPQGAKIQYSIHSIYSLPLPAPIPPSSFGSLPSFHHYLLALVFLCLCSVPSSTARSMKGAKPPTPKSKAKLLKQGSPPFVPASAPPSTSSSASAVAVSSPSRVELNELRTRLERFEELHATRQPANVFPGFPPFPMPPSLSHPYSSLFSPPGGGPSSPTSSNPWSHYAYAPSSYHAVPPSRLIADALKGMSQMGWYAALMSGPPQQPPAPPF